MPVALPRPAVQNHATMPPLHHHHHHQQMGSGRGKTCPSPTFDARSLRNGKLRDEERKEGFTQLFYALSYYGVWIRRLHVRNAQIIEI